MLSRSVTKLVAELYGILFKQRNRTRYGSDYIVDKRRFYDYLYERDYSAWFLSLIEHEHFRNPRSLVEFIMQIHTGESLIIGTQEWTQEQREKYGQQYLKSLTEDIIEHCKAHSFPTYITEMVDKIKTKLELDGYNWDSKSNRLLFSEIDVLDIEEEQGILKKLAIELALANQETTFHHLELSEEHYINDLTFS